VKFACPKCTTRYSIADEKVPAATTLRFPCKKCGTVIRLKRKASGEAKEPVSPVSPVAAAPKTAPVDKASTRVVGLKEINKLRAEAAVAPADGGSTRVANVKDLNRLRAEAAQEFTTEHDPTRVSSRAEIHKVLEEQRRVAEPPPPPPDEQGEWYVLVAGKQKGPMTVDLVMTMLDRNEIDQRTYVWRDGMAEWQRLSAVAEFKERASKAGPAAWRIMQPANESATPAAYDTNESTVAMDPGQLKQELAKTRTATGPAEADQTPVAPEAQGPTDVIERLSPGVSDPDLLDALAGVPTGDGTIQPLSREAPSEGFASAELLSDNLEPVVARASPVGDHMAPSTTAAPSAFPETMEEPVSTPASSMEPFSHPTPADRAPSGVYFTDTSEVNQDYVAAPPGESTRVFMATAGIYKRRRTHRIAATTGILLSVLLVGTVSLDIVGVIQIPGMGAIYDVTGLIDPNKDRAFKRVEDRLSDTALDPAKRAELETMKRRLLGSPGAPQKARAGGARPAAGGAGASGDKVVASEGIKDTSNMTQDQRSLATSVFADNNKRETRVDLAETGDGPAPNLPSGLTQETIFKVITENSRSMNLCLTESMKKGEKLSGKMEIILTIAPDGSVPDAKIEAPELKNTQMATCTIRRIKSWRFPRFNGEPVTVSYPYLLQMGF
jgi:predicted Zn finger-like uncharacterized protein